VTDLTDDLGEVPAYKRGFACVDGEFVPAATASVSIFDHSFLYGDGIFETVVCRRGRPFLLEEHLERLWAGCAYLRIEHPWTSEDIAAQIDGLLRRNGLSEGWVRIVISRGEGYPVSDPRKAVRPTLVVSIQSAPAVVRPRGVGIKLAIAATRRTPPTCLEPRVKSNNYLNHIVAKLEAISAGADDAIMLDLDGNVAELPVANIFARHGTVLSTPPPHGILAGITRATVLGLVEQEVAGDGMTVVERTMAPYDLYTAEELFVVGTGSGVAFVESVNGRSIGDGTEGPVTARIREAYERLLDGELVAGGTR